MAKISAVLKHIGTGRIIGRGRFSKTSCGLQTTDEIKFFDSTVDDEKDLCQKCVRPTRHHIAQNGIRMPDVPKLEVGSTFGSSLHDITK